MLKGEGGRKDGPVCASPEGAGRITSLLESCSLCPGPLTD